LSKCNYYSDRYSIVEGLSSLDKIYPRIGLLTTPSRAPNTVCCHILGEVPPCDDEMTTKGTKNLNSGFQTYTHAADDSRRAQNRGFPPLDKLMLFW
jgi:hypothetical protein